MKLIKSMKVFLYIAIVCLSVSFTSAATFSYEINDTELPFNMVEEFVLSGKENLSINVSYGNFTSGLEFLNFTEELFVLNISINISNTTRVGNYTDIVILNASDTNFSNNITFDFVILNNTNITNETVYVADVDYIQLDINQYEYSICDFQLPYNRTHDVTITAPSGQTIQTLYNSDFINVTDEFIMPITNVTIVPIHIYIPEDTSLGRYEATVRFNVVSIYDNITFYFNLEDCALPISSCNDLYDKMSDVCSIVNKTSDEFLECKRLEFDYDKCVYDAMLDAQEEKVINNTIVEYVNVNRTELIPALPIDDPEILKTLEELVLTWKQMQSEHRQLEKTVQLKDDEITDMQTQLNNMTLNMEDRIRSSLMKLIEDNEVKDNTIETYESEYIKKNTIWLWIFVLLLVCGCGFGYYKYSEEVWW